MLTPATAASKSSRSSSTIFHEFWPGDRGRLQSSGGHTVVDTHALAMRVEMSELKVTHIEVHFIEDLGFTDFMDFPLRHMCTRPRSTPPHPPARGPADHRDAAGRRLGRDDAAHDLRRAHQHRPRRARRVQRPARGAGDTRARPAPASRLSLPPCCSGPDGPARRTTTSARTPSSTSTTRSTSASARPCTI